MSAEPAIEPVEPVVALNVRVPSKLRQDLKVTAAVEETTVRELVISLLSEGLMSRSTRDLLR